MICQINTNNRKKKSESPPELWKKDFLCAVVDSARTKIIIDVKDPSFR